MIEENIEAYEELNASLNGDDDGMEADGIEDDGIEGVANNPLEESQTVEPVKKRIIKNPQPKLNPERLCGPRGIAELNKVVKDFKFKGKHREKEDLNNLMGVLEHWAHRLYPKLPFDNILENIENLGNKKMTKVYVSKIRMGLPVNDEDFVGEEQRDNLLMDDNDPPVEEANNNREDLFDELLRVQRELEEAPQSSQTQPSFPAAATISNEPLTEEEKERLRQKRLLAAEKRKQSFLDQNKSLNISNVQSDMPSSMNEHAEDSLMDTESHALSNEHQDSLMDTESHALSNEHQDSLMDVDEDDDDDIIKINCNKFRKGKKTILEDSSDEDELVIDLDAKPAAETLDESEQNKENEPLTDIIELPNINTISGKETLISSQSGISPRNKLPSVEFDKLQSSNSSSQELSTKKDSDAADNLLNEDELLDLLDD